LRRVAGATLVVALAGTAACVACAQEPAPSVITQQHGGVYIAPPAEVDPVYRPAGPNAGAGQPDTQPPLRLQLTLDVPLRHGGTAALGRGVQGSTAASPTLQAQVRWTPVRQSWWFAQATFYRYLRPGEQQPWHPDFSYGFGYDDPRPGTWSLFYGNYTGTRLQAAAAAGEHRFNFPEGQWTLARRFELPPALQPVLLVGDGDSALCSAEGHVTPRYARLEGGPEGRHKTSLSLGCRYLRASGWYFEAALFAYPLRSQQQPWDPDFTYGFGYADWRPGAIAIRYDNYSGNRFPGRALAAGEGRPDSGSLSVTWSVPW
jgi:hypothetical protein